MSTSELLTYVGTYLPVGGNCYLFKLRSRAGRVVGYMPLHAGQMEPNPAATMNEGMVEHFWYYANGRHTEVAKEDVVHLKWPAINPHQPYLGFSPLELLGLSIGLYQQAREYSMALLSNDAVPRAVLKTNVEGEVMGKDRKAMRQEFDEEYGGAARGGLLVLPPGAEFQRISLDMQELALDALIESSEAEICSAFGVMPGLVGARVGLKHSTFSNREQDRISFYEDRLMPLWSMIGDELSQGMREELGDGHYLSFNGERILRRVQNQDSLYLRTISAYGVGLISEDEARDSLGFDPQESIDESDDDLLLEDDSDNAPTSGTPTSGTPKIGAPKLGLPKGGGTPEVVPFGSSPVG